MEDLNTTTDKLQNIKGVIEKVKRQHKEMINRKFFCEKCNRTVLKTLPKLYNPDTVKCSCGCELKPN